MTVSLKEKITGLGTVVLGAAFFCVLLMIGSMFLNGILWFSQTIYPYLLIIGSFIFWVGICVLLPLAFFKKTRAISGYGFVISSLFYGMLLWLTSLITVYVFWGKIGVVIGIVIAAVGIILEAFIAALFNGAWDELGNLFLWLLIPLVTMGLGMWLLAKTDKDSSSIVDIN
jgi:hypothetical protein